MSREVRDTALLPMVPAAPIICIRTKKEAIRERVDKGAYKESKTQSQREQTDPEDL